MKTIICQYKINDKICGKEFQARTRNTIYCPECRILIKKDWNKKHNDADAKERQKIRRIEKYKKLKEQFKCKVEKVDGVKKMKWVKK